MTVFKRAWNTLRTGGIRELFRKSYYHAVYRFRNLRTRRRVLKSPYEYGLYRGEGRKVPVVVSLTSYPARFSGICLSLKSLLLQNEKPDRIVVWFGSDTKESDLTDEMRDLSQYGIEYRFDPSRNLLAHKKYWYAMQEFENALIVTADDDLFYPADWLSSLLSLHARYPDCVIARRVHRMRGDGVGGLAPYNLWIDQYRRERRPSLALFATGGSGALYPPGILPPETFSLDAITSLCREADDVWLKCMELLSGVSVVWVPSREVDQLGVEARQEEALADKNVGECLNDLLLHRVIDAYGIELPDLSLSREKKREDKGEGMI